MCERMNCLWWERCRAAAPPSAHPLFCGQRGRAGGTAAAVRSGAGRALLPCPALPSPPAGGAAVPAVPWRRVAVAVAAVAPVLYSPSLLPLRSGFRGRELRGVTRRLQGWSCGAAAAGAAARSRARCGPWGSVPPPRGEVRCQAAGWSSDALCECRTRGAICCGGGGARSRSPQGASSDTAGLRVGVGRSLWRVGSRGGVRRRAAATLPRQVTDGLRWTPKMWRARDWAVETVTKGER